jgi:hypothetical protein
MSIEYLADASIVWSGQARIPPFLIHQNKKSPVEDRRAFSLSKGGSLGTNQICYFLSRELCEAVVVSENILIISIPDPCLGEHESGLVEQ